MSQNKVLEFFSQTFVSFYENSRYKLDLNVTEIKLLNYCNNVFAKILYCFHTFSMTYVGCMQCNYIRVVYSFIQVQTLFCLITSIHFYISQCIEDCEDTSYKDL